MQTENYTLKHYVNQYLSHPFAVFKILYSITPSYMNLILGSIALVQCIPLEAREPLPPPPSPSPFEECIGGGYTKDNDDFIGAARKCLSEIPKITCPKTTLDTSKENERFVGCIYENISDIDDQFERAQNCIEEIKKEKCTGPQSPQ
ncbi:hypothetical protein BJ944DRAFT_253247 [Cunninghamella echinulata]|nr:hypothetical protein BJ944DRAFT_253247 [Cunninghamella echinulata]